MKTSLLLLVAAVLIIPTVLGCNNVKLLGCTTKHGTKLGARVIADAVNSNYRLSCEYLNDWYNCMTGNFEDCGDNTHVNEYNKHYDRLRQSPYNCNDIRYASGSSSITASLAVLTAAVLVRFLA